MGPEHRPNPKKQGREPLRKRLGIAALVTLVGAILAAAISGTTLTFELWPGLKPDPKERVEANLAIMAFDRNVSWQDHLARVGSRAAEGGNPNDAGNIFYLRAHIEGFKRESLELKWFTYDDNGERRNGPRSGASEETVFRPEAPINTQVAQVWVRTPNQSGTFFVRFELYSGKVLLAFKDSRDFSVERF